MGRGLHLRIGRVERSLVHQLVIELQGFQNLHVEL